MSGRQTVATRVGRCGADIGGALMVLLQTEGHADAPFAPSKQLLGLR